MAKADLQAKMNLDSTGFQRNLEKSKASLGKFGKTVNRVGNRLAKMGLASAAAAFVMLSKRAVSLGSELSDIAQSTNFATEQFQVFRGALIDAGGKAESMEKSIQLMQKAVVQGSEGLTTYLRAFERLGLNVDDLRAMKPEQQFQTIAKAIAGAKDQQGAFTAAVEIFGQRNAPRLMEVFKRLDEDGYGKMAKEIEAAYGIMDAETQAALDRAADRIEQFKNKATIKVGELIAMEGDGAAFKVLTARFFGVIAKVSVGFLEIFHKIAGTIPTLIGGALEGVANKFGFSLEAVALNFKIKMMEAANAVIQAFNNLTGRNVGIFALGPQFKKLRDVIERTEDKGAGVLDTALSKVEKLWKSEPLKGWKDSIDAGTDEIVKAYEGDLKAAKEAAKVRKEGLTVGISPGSSGSVAATTGGNTNTPETGQPETPATAKARSKVRGKIRTGQITSRGLGTRGSRFGRMPTMTERERAAGIFNTEVGKWSAHNAGRGPAGMAAKRGPAGMTQGASAGSQGSIEGRMLEHLRSIDLEIKRNP